MLDDLLQNFLKKINSQANRHRSPTRSSSVPSRLSNPTSHAHSASSASRPVHSASSSSFSSDSAPNSDSSSFSRSSSPTQPAFTPAKEAAPQTLAEFIELIKNTPKSVLSAKDRKRIAAVMSFDERTVRDVMVPKRDMIFVKDTEILGPLTLDKLYQSGFNIFPVVDSSNHVLGVIHTEALNALEIRETDRATKYLDTLVHYLHTTNSLQYAISEIERTNSYYFLVLDELETLAGFFTIQQLLDYLLS